MEFLPLSAFSLQILYATYTLVTCRLLCEVSQKSVRGISRYLGNSKKRYALCINWRLDLMQTNLLLFGCFRKVFITHSFCKWPLYTLQPASRLERFRNWHENVWISKLQRWALFVISKKVFYFQEISETSGHFSFTGLSIFGSLNCY